MPDGIVFLYGPFMVGGRHTATTNATFDADLNQRDPRWGVHDVDDIVREAMPNGLEPREIVEMPANNLLLVLVKSSGGLNPALREMISRQRGSSNPPTESRNCNLLIEI